MELGNGYTLWLKATETVEAVITGKRTSVSLALLIGI